MISSVRKIKYIGTLWCLLALYFLNISVDATDVLYTNTVEDLSINNQESMIEMIVEKVLGYENAIAEHDDNDNQQSSTFKKYKIIEFIVENSTSTATQSFLVSIDKNPINYYPQITSNPETEIVVPPPKI